MEIKSLNQPLQDSASAAQLKAGFGSLRFDGPLEKEFRESYLEENLPRARLSGLLALVLLLAVTCLSFLLSGDNEFAINRLRIGVMLPILVAALIVCYYPGLQRYYLTTATIAISLFGTVASYNAINGALQGKTYLLAGLVLIVIYPCFFLGLFFNRAVAVAAVLVVFFAAAGWYLGLDFNTLFYSTAILAAATTIGAHAAYNLEHAHRTNFLETRLLNELAERDGLTGLYNRRIFDDYVQRLWRQSRRDDVPLAIIFVDIDFFKLYNDLYGHQAGDDCLKRVAECMSRMAKRPFDFCARYGGEEFVLVLYGPPRDYAESLPEKIRRDVSALEISHSGSEVAGNVTVSVGVAIAYPGVGRSLAGAIQLADQALYQAKAEGRNRVVFKDAEATEVQTGNFQVSAEIRRLG